MAAAMGMNAQIPPGANPSQQQAYADAVNAMAMQQAAAVAVGHPIPFFQNLQFPGIQFPLAGTGQPAAPVDPQQQQQQQQHHPQQVQQQQQATEPAQQG